MELSVLTIFYFVIVIADVNGGQCHHTLRRLTFTQTVRPHHHKMTLRLSDPMMVERIKIRICDKDKALANNTFNVTFVDTADVTQQERIYSENVIGEYADADNFMFLFNPAMYTKTLIFNNWNILNCSLLHVLGCNTYEMFDKSFCKNGGKHVGNEQCACPTGYFGAACELPVQDMVVDNFEFITNISNIVFTKDAAFNVSGDISFIFHGQTKRTSKTRRNTHPSGHHGFAHFIGHGGSLHISATHIAGFMHKNHHTAGHHPSHSIYSALNNFVTGFSYRFQVMVGRNHHHSNMHYFYTTHGTNHFSHGASLHFQNNFLHMHVHYTHSNGHHHHFHVHFKWNPVPDHKYHIVSSFHPRLGASIYINGHIVASIVKRTAIPSNYHFPGVPKPLCIGHCGAQAGNGPFNVTFGNILVTGANVATMANNHLLGLLGSPMLNLLKQQNNTGTHQTPHHQSTTVPSRSTAATNGPTTTSHHGGFTTAPTTTPPATATSAKTFIATTTSSSAPKCYTCTNVNVNGNCSKQSQCYTGEVCAVYGTNIGYTHRCMGQKLCDASKKTAAGCWNCCTGNLCNQKCLSVASCVDTPQCAMLQTIGYNVCSDPIASVTACPKTCSKCPSSG